MTTSNIRKSYGLLPDEVSAENQFIKYCDEVAGVLGRGKNKVADIFIFEIAKTETGLGTIEDKTAGAGMGICQHDKFPFEDNQRRYKDNDISLILSKWGLDMRTIKWDMLKDNIFISIIATRLHFKPFSQDIPGNMVGRARYWKKYYNTFKGKGTVKHYLKMNGFDMSKYNPSMEIKSSKEKCEWSSEHLA
jgi:hypothetical protein